ncbi:phosphoglycerate/bisphosphoglycerate mutase [Parvularcula bermudensis HTCC2503]|uniref:Phosphoglycerate/bisphosphoglycerate mutase n=1 Tax=Parvularcula bermudensis (strain ATCC BAA-594 / HTCC2503 / KCTC 12087) TaxID=314260 RepID=E0TEW9_PARBH|nr:histidine phosphatase family protein [Parvularcula bermudensis]ADM10062.1 phosphoglycerate/bisphosphoglycerate mutase [Parvularcula bermudensis HTCC2503]
MGPNAVDNCARPLPGGPVVLPFPLYFIRHGQTDWNKEGRFQGHSDIPLNDTGKAQAGRNGQTLAAQLGPAAAAYDFAASPLSRARQTMEIIRNALGLPASGYTLDARLLEVDLGDWNGQTVADIEAHSPGIWKKRQADKWAFAVPGGEAYKDAAVRIRHFLEDLRRPTVIVGHGASGRILRGYCIGLDQSRVGHLPSPQDRVFHLTEGTETSL